MATDATYPKTPVGAVEVKTLPPALAYEARGKEDAWRDRDDMFYRDFAFLHENELAMTTPVEVEVERPRMRFFVPREDETRVLKTVDGVDLHPVESREVIATGLRGNYSPRNFERGRARIEAWLAEHPEYRPTGPAYAVYWNAPLTPPFIKRSEVHVPVERVGAGPARA
ncbi:MAG TPA: heme-binding protein [Candidatus Thermoplasmatota archaeon]|nr:heme-binding protein [Candidatus Thermoplasmatota archaeon]